jgi:hypothetical protein
MEWLQNSKAIQVHCVLKDHLTRSGFLWQNFPEGAPLAPASTSAPDKPVTSNATNRVRLYGIRHPANKWRTTQQIGARRSFCFENPNFKARNAIIIELWAPDRLALLELFTF